MSDPVIAVTLPTGYTGADLRELLADIRDGDILVRAVGDEQSVTLAFARPRCTQPAGPEPEVSDEDSLTAAVRRLSGPGPVPGRPTLGPKLRAEGIAHNTDDLAAAIRTVRAERGRPADR